MRKLISIPTNVIAVLFAAFCVLLPRTVFGAEPVATITVDSGSYARVDTPVSVVLDGVTLGMADERYYLIERGDASKTALPVQIEAGSPPRLWFILPGRTKAESKRVFELYPGSGDISMDIIEARKDNKRLVLQRGEDRILSYYHAIVPPPEGRGEIYQRSGFIYPIWSPAGNIVSEIHPRDHVHHFGVWMPWTHTRYEGKLVDFWNIQDGTGTVRFSRFVSTTQGPVYGGFQVEQDHVALKTSTGEKVILKEVWDVRAYNVGGPDKGYWLWDFKSTQRNITELPLIQEEYRYGGFAYRGATQWKGQNAAYLSSEGNTHVDGNGKRSRWCDMSGSIDGQWEGVDIMSNPNNFRHPEPMRIMDHTNYVYFVYCPSVLGEWEMKPGQDHVFRYRLYVHEGKVNVDDNERFWADYAEPPEVSITPIQSGSAIILFDGKDFSQWTGENQNIIGWRLEDGVMTVVPGSGSIMTKESFGDFRMHLEFRLPQMEAGISGQDRANSGVYIQRRYEVQILDSYGLEPVNNGCGALYEAKSPNINACAKPNEWQSYDIIFHAARYDDNQYKKIKNANITVWQNGILIHNNVQIPDKTGAGKPEGPEPAPVLLQNHGNEVSFRNIWIEPL